MRVGNIFEGKDGRLLNRYDKFAYRSCLKLLFHRLRLKSIQSILWSRINLIEGDEETTVETRRDVCGLRRFWGSSAYHETSSNFVARLDSPTRSDPVWAGNRKGPSEVAKDDGGFVLLKLIMEQQRGRKATTTTTTMTITTIMTIYLLKLSNSWKEYCEITFILIAHTRIDVYRNRRYNQIPLFSISSWRLTHLSENNDYFDTIDNYRKGSFIATVSNVVWKRTIRRFVFVFHRKWQLV